LSSLTENELSLYKDRVIGYNLYHWINDWDKKKVNELVDDKVIEKAIKENVSCNSEESSKKCFYKFREKYRNLPYIAYKIWLEVQNDRTAWLLEFLQDLPPAIAITSFSFQKYSNSSFLNNDQDKYEGRVTFNAYWRNISDSELEEASLMLWKLCFWSDFKDGISPELALNYVNDTISKYGWNHEYDNVPPLLELQKLFTSINESYGGMNNYDKIIKLFEIWRMMNDGNLCEK
jgi:hypothetical protein